MKSASEWAPHDVPSYHDWIRAIQADALESAAFQAQAWWSDNACIATDGVHVAGSGTELGQVIRSLIPKETNVDL